MVHHRHRLVERSDRTAADALQLVIPVRQSRDRGIHCSSCNVVTDKSSKPGRLLQWQVNQPAEGVDGKAFGPGH